jgi:hypothetical protein
MVTVTSELFGVNDLSMCMVSGYVMTSSQRVPPCGCAVACGSVTWEFHTQSPLQREMHVDIHAKCLLSDFNQNWNVLTNFSETPQYKIS